MTVIPLRQIISEYIGGGWGKESPDEKHSVDAYVIRGTDLDSVQSGLTDDVPYRWHQASNVCSRSLAPGDIIFEVSGGSKDQPVGRSLLLDDSRVARFSSAVIPASFCKKIRPDPTRVDPRFLWAHLKLAWSDRRIVQWQVQSTGISNFKFESFLDDFLITLPPLPIQRRIAGILSAYDELIENSQRRIRILEAMARALYREWFVHFRFPGHEHLPRVPSPLGEIPQGWEVKKLGEIAEEMRRNVPKGELDEPQPYVGLEHIPRRSLALDSWETTTELGSNKLEFKKGEILFGKIRPYFHKVREGLINPSFVQDRSATIRMMKSSFGFSSFWD